MRFEPVTLLALRVIADAVARAHAGQVERGWGHRLALRWLVDAGIAEPWQARDFWADLAMQWDAPEFESNAYSQVSRLHGALPQWSYRAGMAPPDPVEAHRLARPWMPDLEFDCGTQQLPCMCNRYMPGDRHRVEDHFSARAQREFNAGPAIFHPREPGWVVRLVASERVLEQMTWGFPVYLRGKAGQPLKARPVNNPRFDKLGGYWKRWAADPASRCLIPAAAYAEAVGPAGVMTDNAPGLEAIHALAGDPGAGGLGNLAPRPARGPAPLRPSLSGGTNHGDAYRCVVEARRTGTASFALPSRERDVVTPLSG